MSRPLSFVLVPGAWHRAEIWNKVTSIIDAKGKGYKWTSVTLPSTTGDASAGIGDDVTAVQGAIRTHNAQGRDVVVVVHSYGGLVGSSSVKGLTRKDDEDSSSGHVIGLAMISTGFAITGLSVLEHTGGKPPWWFADSGFATVTEDTTSLFYHDVPQNEAALWVSKLTKHSLKSLAEGGEHVYAGWKDVPCWFLVTQQDKSLAVELQRLFVKAAQDEGGDVTMREVASSHSPMLSRPDETANFVLEAAEHFASN